MSYYWESHVTTNFSFPEQYNVDLAFHNFKWDPVMKLIKSYAALLTFHFVAVNLVCTVHQQLTAFFENHMAPMGRSRGGAAGLDPSLKKIMP